MAKYLDSSGLTQLWTACKNTFLTTGGGDGRYLKLSGGTLTGAVTFNGEVYSTYHISIGHSISSYSLSRAEMDIITAADDATDLWMGVNKSRCWDLSCRSSRENNILVIYNKDVSQKFYFTQDGDFYAYGGFVKKGSSNSYVLLGGGGHKAISDFATSNHTHNYIDSVLDRAPDPSEAAPVDLNEQVNTYGTKIKYNGWSYSRSPYVSNYFTTGTSAGSVWTFPDKWGGLQIATPHSQSTMYFRKYYNGNWDSWVNVITSANISSQSVSYASSAGSVAWSGISDKPETATRWPSWSEVTSKPSSFTPSAHDHTYLKLNYSRGGQSTSGEWSKIKNGTSNTESNKVQFWTIYNDGGPTTYGEMLEILSYNANHWQPQLWFGSGKGAHMYYRNKGHNDDTWGDWLTIIDSGNYTSYTVTKTGTGASGTWGINITGSAGSVAWANVSGKPDTYTPSTHNHDGTYLKLSGTETITGQKNFNTSTNTVPVIISRLGQEAESLKIGVDDHTAHFKHSQDEQIADFYFDGVYSDSENGGANPGQHRVWFALGLNRAAIYLDSNTVLHSGNWSSYCAAASHTHSYLPLSGGAMTGDLTINHSASNGPRIYYKNNRIAPGSGGWADGIITIQNASGTSVGEFGIYGNADVPSYLYIGQNVYNGSNLRIYTDKLQFGNNLIWHAGNDGSGSGLDADLLDGKHASDFSLSGHTHSYISSAGFSSSGSTTLATWGTLTAANGYTGVLNITDPNSGSWEIAYKDGQQFHQIDGYYYQNEGRYKVTDVTETVTALGTSGNNLTWTKNGTTNNITVPYATAAANSDAVDGYHAYGINNTSNYLIKQSYINPPGDADNDHWYRIATIKNVGGSNYKVLLYISTNYPRQSALVEITYRGNSWKFVEGYFGTIPAGNIRMYYDDANYTTVPVEIYILIPKTSTGSRTVNTRVIAEVQRYTQFPNIVELDSTLIEPTLTSYVSMAYNGFLGNAATATSATSATSASSADKATKLATARNLKVDLSSSSAQGFNGTADATSIGVFGTLPFANLPAMYCANVGISSQTNDKTEPTFKSAIIGTVDEATGATPFINVLRIRNNCYSSQVYDHNTDYTTDVGSWGISFDRGWYTSSESNNSAGIYAFGTGSWGCGLVFRTMSGGLGQGAGHNNNALILRGNGKVVAPNGIIGDLTGTTTNLAGGAKGSIPYQSTANTTTMLAVGSVNQVLSINSSSLPVWVSAPGLNKVGTVTSITLKAGTGISLDTNNTAITDSGTRTITNSGVRATTISGNYLRVNTNGTNADLTIPYAIKAEKDINNVSLINYKLFSSIFTEGGDGETLAGDGATRWYTIANYTNNYYSKTATFQITTRRSTAMFVINFYNTNTPYITGLSYDGACSTTAGGFAGKIRVIADGNNAIIQGQFYAGTSTSSGYHILGIQIVSSYNTSWVISNTIESDETEYESTSILTESTLSLNAISSRHLYPLVTATYNIGSSSLKYNKVYADTFYGDLSGSASSVPTLINSEIDTIMV